MHGIEKFRPVSRLTVAWSIERTNEEVARSVDECAQFSFQLDSAVSLLFAYRSVFFCMLIMGRCWCASVGAEKWDNMQNCCERFVTRAITPCFDVLHRKNKKSLVRLSSRKQKLTQNELKWQNFTLLIDSSKTRKKRSEKEVEDYVDAN